MIAGQFSHRYVGSEAIRERALKNIQRAEVESPNDIRSWRQTSGIRADGSVLITLTFVIDTEERLWIADRRSEHVACANGGNVFAAGELTFAVGTSGMDVVEATNQSTGYCPQVTPSWNVLSRVLDRLKISRPPFYTSAFEFRRCDSCEAINLIKDDYYVCGECDQALSKEWNFW
jgi:hypothetical protein